METGRLTFENSEFPKAIDSFAEKGE